MGLQVRPGEVVAAEAAAERAAEPEVGRRRFAAPSASGVALAVVLLVAGAFLTVLSRRLWFFGDDFEFLLTRGTVPGYDRGLFMPHNEHWSTLPILVFRGLFALFGFRYLPYALVVIAAHLAVCVVVYLLLKRVGIGPWAAVVACTFFAFFGAGAENTTWDFQIGFVGAVLFGFLAILLWDLTRDLRFRLVPTWVASILALMSAGIALPMLATLGVYVACRRGVAEAARVLSVPVAVYAVWWLTTGRQGSGPQRPSLGVIPLIPQYVGAGLTTIWNTSLAIPASGAVMVALLGTVALVGRWGLPAARHLALAGLAGTILLFVLTGLVRLAPGTEPNVPSRYLYVGGALLLPGLAVLVHHVLGNLGRPAWVSWLAVAGILGLVVLNGVQLTRETVTDRAVLTTLARDRMVATVSLLRSGVPVLNPAPERLFNPDLQTYILDKPEIQGALPEAPVTPQTLLDASAAIQVRVDPAPAGLPPAAAAQPVSGFASKQAVTSGCATLDAVAVPATVAVPTGSGGAELTIQDAHGKVDTTLQREGLTSAPVSWPVDRPGPVHVATNVPNATLLLSVTQTGPVSVCLG
jgi:hypothetical protein